MYIAIGDVLYIVSVFDDVSGQRLRGREECRDGSEFGLKLAIEQTRRGC